MAAKQGELGYVSTCKVRTLDGQEHEITATTTGSILPPGESPPSSPEVKPPAPQPEDDTTDGDVDG